ncbi:MAG: hypothetical protein K5852_01720 [Eubacterium sp.]|nr:hypothetical protein [Eubacterium sp.]
MDFRKDNLYHRGGVFTEGIVIESRPEYPEEKYIIVTRDGIDQLRDQYEQQDHDHCYKSYKSKKNGQSPSAAFQILERVSPVKLGQGIHQIGNDTPYGHRIKIGAYGLLDPCKLRQVCQDVKQDDADEQSDKVGVSSF